ncbi:MAG: hypothetical protein ACREIC_19875, partial [Limisphaerales bacterium]
MNVELGVVSELIQRLDAVILWIEARKWAERNLALIAVALSAISLVTACPDYARFGPYPGVPWAAEAVSWKFQHPFARIPVSEFRNQAGASGSGIIEQLEKRSYRIAIPATANVLGMSVTHAIAIQQVAAVAFLGMFVLLARETLGDATSALFAGVMAATSFIGQWGFNDFTNFDGSAYLILLLLLWARWPVFVALLAVVGGFCDERVILATPLVWLWHVARGAPGDPSQSLVCEPGNGPIHYKPAAFRPDRVTWGLLVGLIGFSVLRLLLGYRWGQMVNTSGMGIGVVKSNLLWLPLALFAGIKGGMLLLLGAGSLLVVHRRMRYMALVGFACAPCMLAALWVYDLTRSLAFGFPAYFLAMTVLRRHMSAIEIRRLTFVAALGCA